MNTLSEVEGNLIVPIFRRQNTRVFLNEKRVYEKLSTRSSKKLVAFLTVKGTISLNIPGIFVVAIFEIS